MSNTNKACSQVLKSSNLSYCLFYLTSWFFKPEVHALLLHISAIAIKSKWISYLTRDSYMLWSIKCFTFLIASNVRAFSSRFSQEHSPHQLEKSFWSLLSSLNEELSGTTRRKSLIRKQVTRKPLSFFHERLKPLIIPSSFQSDPPQKLIIFV